MMTSFSEQRAAVKYCLLLGKNAAEIVEITYKDDVMGKTHVCERFAPFRNNGMSIDGRS